MNRKKILSHILPYILLIIGMCAVISQKENLHVDGFYTYGLSNHPYMGSIGMNPVEGRVYVPAESAWMEYLSVQENHRFDYVNVWKNQEADVHPPLYYALVHTVCSFFPGTFSIWYAGCINILFGCLTLYAAGKLIRELTGEDRGILLFSAAFALSPGILSAAAFLRMYMMAMFFVTFVSWLFVRIWKHGSCRKCLTAAGISCAMGVLTHYYFLVWLFFLCAAVGLALLYRKRFCELFQLAASVSAGILGGVILFPRMIYHIFLEKGDRGAESVEKLRYMGVSENVQKLKDYFGYLNDQLFGKLFLAAVILVLAAVAVSAAGKTAKTDRNRVREKMEPWLLLLIPCFCYYVLIARISVYTADRYIQPIYGVVLTLGLGGVLTACKVLFRDKKVSALLTLCFFMAVTVNGLRICPWEYLYREDGILLDELEAYTGADCLYVYDADDPSRIQHSYFEGKLFGSVFFVSDEHLELAAESGILEKSSLLLCTDYATGGEKTVEEILESSNRLQNSVCLGKYGFYTTTWYLSE